MIEVKAAEIGLVSPPMGLDVFIASAASRIDTRTVFRGTMPFVVVELILLALLVAFPQSPLWLRELLSR